VPYSKSNRILADSGIGILLRRARERRKRSQEDLATRVGMSAASISHIELGSDLKTSTLLRLAAESRLEVLIVPAEAVPYVRAVLADMRIEGDG
jgi:transcriptional regulator with XRE-family HTH domain